MPRSDMDWVLSAMLEGVSAAGAGLDLTVFSGGLVITGTAVGDEVFFQRQGLSGAAEFVAREGEDVKKKRANIKALLERGDISMDDRESLQSKMDALEREFITLIDVTILGAGPTPIKAPAWRGRLSQISGWVLGSPGEPQ